MESPLVFCSQRSEEFDDYLYIKVNAVHPGYVDTDMSSHKGLLSIDEGAAAPLFLALDADDSVKGQYVWFDKQITSWEGKTPTPY